MNLSDLVSSTPARWGLPITILVSVFGAFKTIEGNSSKQMKIDLSQFIKSAKYEDYLGVLPDAIQDGFDKLMGTRHLSKKSLKRSFLFSVIATAAAILFSVIYNHKDISVALANYPEAIKNVQDTLAKNPSFARPAEFVGRLKNARNIVIALPIIWVFWCFVPDFIALLKTRIVLLVLKHSAPRISSLLVVFFVDILLSVISFVMSTVLFQVILGYAFYWYNYGFDFSITSFFIYSGMLFTFEFSIFVLSGAILFSIPMANLFWASALPSIWLWTYIFSALLARFLLRSKPLLRSLVYFLDFDEKPVSSLGILAGGVAALACLVFLIIMEAIRHT